MPEVFFFHRRCFFFLLALLPFLYNYIHNLFVIWSYLSWYLSWEVCCVFIVLQFSGFIGNTIFWVCLWIGIGWWSEIWTLVMVKRGRKRERAQKKNKTEKPSIKKQIYWNGNTLFCISGNVLNIIKYVLHFRRERKETEHTCRIGKDLQKIMCLIFHECIFV